MNTYKSLFEVESAELRPGDEFLLSLAERGTGMLARRTRVGVLIYGEPQHPEEKLTLAIFAKQARRGEHSIHMKRIEGL
jgi:hypothetical protein